MNVHARGTKKAPSLQPTKKKVIYTRRCDLSTFKDIGGVDTALRQFRQDLFLDVMYRYFDWRAPWIDSTLKVTKAAVERPERAFP